MDAVEARGAADGCGVNAWSGASALDEVEGVTARMVDLCGRGGTSSSTSKAFSFPKNDESSRGDDGGVLPWEKRLDEGENEDATRVSASDVLVDVECLSAFLCCKGLGTRVWFASNFATTLATNVRSETPEPLRSNAYPGALRGGNI